MATCTFPPRGCVLVRRFESKTGVPFISKTGKPYSKVLIARSADLTPKDRSNIVIKKSTVVATAPKSTPKKKMHAALVLPKLTFTPKVPTKVGLQYKSTGQLTPASEKKLLKIAESLPDVPKAVPKPKKALTEAENIARIEKEWRKIAKTRTKPT